VHKRAFSQVDAGDLFLEALVFVEKAHENRGLPCPTVLSVPKSKQGNRVGPLARAAQGASRYCLSFTAAGLRPDLAAVMAGIYLEEGDWVRAKAVVLERNALQARSSNTAKRLEMELRQRLQELNPAQLALLAQGTSDERSAMAWLAVLKRIEIAADLTREVLADKANGPDPVLRRSDVAAFYEATERTHPELVALAPSSQQKVRSALLQMLRDARLLVGKPGQGGTLGTVQRPLLSPQAHDLVFSDHPALLAGFLLSPAAERSRPSRSSIKAATPSSCKSAPKKAPASRRKTA
jgi:hypothetical protein